MNTKEQILDAAQMLCQKVGHHGFSFRDLGQALGIKSASVHHHFPTKEALLRAIIARYGENFAKRLAAIDQQGDIPARQLELFVRELERNLVEDSRVCLCGMLAAESESLSADVRNDIQGFFRGGSAWLAAVLERGRKDGSLSFVGKAEDIALVLITSLQGMLIASRVLNGVQTFRQLSQDLIRGLLAKQELAV